MLDSKDVEVLQGLFQELFQNTLDKRLTNSENMILKEIDRAREETNQRIGKLERNIELMKQEIGTLRLDMDNVNLFLRIVNSLQKQNEELQKRIEALEQKIA